WAEEGTEEAVLLEDTLYTQPSLFALETALYRLLQHLGVTPHYLAGHSIGEIAAAHAAGVLSLEDACTLVATRARLLHNLPAGGAMTALQATEAEVLTALRGHPAVTVAALNTPDSTVISGDAGTVAETAARFAEQGRKITPLHVSHAFHSPHLDPVLDEFHAVAETLTYQRPRIPIVSTLTGRLASAEDLTSAHHWTRQLRQAVRFHPALTTLTDLNTTTYLELGPDTTLTTLASTTTGDAVAIPLLHPDKPETHTLLTALATAHTHATPVDWTALYTPHHPTTVDLPTYPFQHHPYWLHPTPTVTDATDLGQAPSTHPFLGAIAELPGNAYVFTGRLSLDTHPWVADHTIHGTAVLPAAALVDLALHVARRTGRGGIRELTVDAPLTLVAGTAVRLRVTVEAAAERELPAVLTIDTQSESDPEAAWITRASAAVEPAAADVIEDLVEERPPWAVVWPPEAARAISVDELYEDLATAGLRYGPVFQGVRAAWQRGDTVYAEVDLPEEPGRTSAACDGFGVHPALLDAALHPLLRPLGADGGNARTSLRWSGVSLHGEPSSVLRVRLTPAGADALAVEIADDTGVSVATAAAVRLGALPDSLPRASRSGSVSDHLFRLNWEPAAPKRRDRRGTGTWAVLGEDGLGIGASLEAAGQVGVAAFPDVKALVAALDSSEGGAPQSVVVTCVRADVHDAAQAAHTMTERLLTLLQAWLAEPRLAGSRLVVVTRGAVATSDAEGADDLGAAAVWGLLRSAQSENPGQFQLLDTDGTDASLMAVATALEGDEPQIALRDGTTWTPHLTEERVVTVPPPLDPDGTVLVTGGTGTLGAITARHLITRHGAHHLLLTSRRGPNAPGATQLHQELTRLGAHITITASDTSDPHQLAHLLASIPAEHPLTAVIHTA
ncbi:acyltransferase domain-containing protein, partial [Streptomyces lucensis]|uniref:acyltransferase domain-containing protein n=1 Tax=Streptomyces lucensis TaxID=67319 RepID=UPI001679CE69